LKGWAVGKFMSSGIAVIAAHAERGRRRSCVASTFVLAAALSLGATMAASAADLPVKGSAYKAPPAVTATWSGLYAGGAVGFRYTNVDANLTRVLTNGIDDIPAFCGTIGGCRGETFDSSGFKGGVYAGYNWQFSPRWVAGIEGDWMWADHEATITGTFFPTNFPGSFGVTLNPIDSFTVKTEWDASIRGRLGFLISPSVMAFATGGASWLKLETTSACNNVGVCLGAGGLLPGTVSISDTVLGWTVGGGIEAMLSPNWLVRAEYRYADYGTNSYTVTRSNGPITRVSTYDVDLKTHTALFGIAYKFGDAHVVAKY
jgi:outer membrane immunogenic protein